MIRKYHPKGGRPDPSQRRCYDCANLDVAVSMWCTSEEARMYSIGACMPNPSFCDCPWWRPMEMATWWDRLIGYPRLLVVTLTVEGEQR